MKSGAQIRIEEKRMERIRSKLCRKPANNLVISDKSHMKHINSSIQYLYIYIAMYIILFCRMGIICRNKNMFNIFCI